jgi:hypothetical protein
MENLPDRMYCEAILDDSSGFRFFLREEGREGMLQVSFDSELAYRKTDEGDLLLTFQSVPKIGERSHVYESRDSEFLAWFHRESFGIHEKSTIRHYLFLTSNDCIEVIALEPPIARWVDSVK